MKETTFEIKFRMQILVDGKVIGEVDTAPAALTISKTDRFGDVIEQIESMLRERTGSEVAPVACTRCGGDGFIRCEDAECVACAFDGYCDRAAACDHMPAVLRTR